MSLDEKRIKEIMKAPPQKEVLLEAENHENRLSLHSETEITKRSRNEAFKDFLAYAKALLPLDKYQRFESLIKTPYATLDLTGEIFTEQARIFDGQNAFFNYDFTTSDLQADFSEYLKELDDMNFFKTRGFEQLKTGINSVLVVDLPREVSSDRLEPFYYFVDVRDIIDVRANHKGEIKHIIFKLSETLRAVYDDEFYRIYEDKDGRITQESKSAHDLGYCPATFFWDKNLRKDNPILKKSPLTNSLSSLDRYLFLDTSKEHADLYSAFPIVVSMEKLCNFEGCQNGYITKELREDYYNEHIGAIDSRIVEQTVKCQSCEERELIGAGTNFEYPAPQSNEDPNLSNPVEIITAETKPLEYLRDKLEALANKIKSATIGTGSKQIDTQAINELQVMGSFESRRNALITLKESFEKVHKFANDTVARLRYGDRFEGSVVFYGDEFYLKNLATLQEEYKQAKENGEPDEEIDAIYRQIIQTKYKGNNDKIQRHWILLNVNPMPHNSLKEATELRASGAVSEEDYIIKARFNAFIARFEREQTNVIHFGDNEEFNTRIYNIYSQLKMYANESSRNSQSEQL
jgi:hypothetical protein